MQIVIKRLTRWLVRAVSPFLPEAKAQALERWRRGREEFRKLGLTHHVVVSYGKSGRTWLRVMLSRYYQLTYGLPDRLLLGFDNYHRKNPSVPQIFFTHDNYLRGYTGNLDSKRDFYDKKVVLLVRRPQDVAVSQYFQWQYRMRPRKKTMNRYPRHGAEVSLFDFVTDPDAGLPRIIEYLNLWASELPHIKDLLVVRYEDMRAEPVKVFGGIVEFLGEQPANLAHVEAAVEFASVDNLRQLERQKFFRRSGSRMTPRDRSNPHTYKVRRAKVGGYRDYFDSEQIAQIDALVSARLSPVFGYGEAAGKSRPAQPASSAAGAATA